MLHFLSKGRERNHRELQSLVVGQLPGYVLHPSLLPRLSPHLQPVSPHYHHHKNYLIYFSLLTGISFRSCSPREGKKNTLKD